MKRLFQHLYTVRYDETDCYGFLTPTTFLQYMQEIAARDAEAAQLDGKGYWVVKRTAISFKVPVPVHTTLKLTTFGIGFTRITAQRGYEATSEVSAEPLISARTLWVYLDTRGHPTRLPPGTERIWLPDGPEPQLAESPWPALPEHTPERMAYRVRFSDVDRMQHMNNAAYVQAFDDAAWEAYSRAGITPETATLEALTYDIDYGESARLGEMLEIQTWFDPSPSAGKEFRRLQQITREGVVLVRAYSHWRWKEAE